MADPQEKPNPFLGYLQSLPGRLLKTPINALKLPVNIGAEVAGVGDRVVQAEQTQRDFIGRVTGQRPDYSEGKRMANMFSLGLVPNNPSAAIDPTTLPPDQQQNFGKLTKLQQALVQAKRPADFAKLIQDGSLFEEDPPEEMIQVPPQTALVDPKTHEEVYKNGGAPVKLGPNDRLSSSTGETLNSPPTETLAGQTDPKMLLKTYTPESIQKFSESKDFSDLVVDHGKLEREFKNDMALEDKKNAGRLAVEGAKAKGKGAKPLTLLDTNRVTTPYLSATADVRKFADKARTFVGLTQLSPGEIPGDVRQDFNNLGIDVTQMEPTAVSDSAMIVGFLKVMEPESVARESEQVAMAAARRLRMPVETIRAVLTGRPLLPEQRTQMFQTMRDAFVMRIRGYDTTRAAFKKLSETYLEGADPDVVVPDLLKDLRPFIEGAGGGSGESPDQQQMIEQRVNDIDSAFEAFVSEGNDPNDEQGFRKFATERGVVLPE